MPANTLLTESYVYVHIPISYLKGEANGGDVLTLDLKYGSTDVANISFTATVNINFANALSPFNFFS